MPMNEYRGGEMSTGCRPKFVDGKGGLKTEKQVSYKCGY